MRVPSFRHVPGWQRDAGLILLGMILGASLFITLNQKLLNAYMEENRVLRIEKRMLLENQTSRETYRNRPDVIRSIILFFEDDPKTELTELTRAELKELVRSDLKVLIGKPVNDITPPADNGTRVLKTLYERLHQDVNGTDYLVTINDYVIIYGELRVWLGVREYAKN
jgi:hypothetical protein